MLFGREGDVDAGERLVGPALQAAHPGHEQPVTGLGLGGDRHRPRRAGRRRPGARRARARRPAGRPRQGRGDEPFDERRAGGDHRGPGQPLLRRRPVAPLAGGARPGEGGVDTQHGMTEVVGQAVELFAEGDALVDRVGAGDGRQAEQEHLGQEAGHAQRAGGGQGLGGGAEPLLGAIDPHEQTRPARPGARPARPAPRPWMR